MMIPRPTILLVFLRRIQWSYGTQQTWHILTAASTVDACDNGNKSDVSFHCGGQTFQQPQLLTPQAPVMMVMLPIVAVLTWLTRNRALAKEDDFESQVKDLPKFTPEIFTPVYQSRLSRQEANPIAPIHNDHFADVMVCYFGQ